jgi:HAD superfamily hydrolase (TIGR01450 family)
MKDYRALLLDLDGVVYRGQMTLPGARELVEWADATARRVVFVSNNSFASPDDVTTKLARLGIPRPHGRVVTAASAAARLLAHRFPGGRVYSLAVPSVAALLTDAGLRLAWQDADDELAPDAVLVGLDRALTYDKLRRGLRAILAGAAFVAINRDPRLPVENGFEPGTGSIVVSLEYASGKQAEVVGKPAPGLLFEALALVGAAPDQALMIGDGLDLDVVAGHRAGVDTALVLTGLTTAEQASAATDERAPGAIYRDLLELLEGIRAAE